MNRTLSLILVQLRRFFLDRPILRAVIAVATLMAFGFVVLILLGSDPGAAARTLVPILINSLIRAIYR
jgi:hypothetical protein